jgi:hypothetical protein
MNKARKVVFHSVTQDREAKAKALSEGRADHNSPDYPIWYSLRANGFMAGSCANPTIGIMSRLRTLFVFGFLAFAPSKECCDVP